MGEYKVIREREQPYAIWLKNEPILWPCKTQKADDINTASQGFAKYSSSRH